MNIDFLPAKALLQCGKAIRGRFPAMELALTKEKAEECIPHDGNEPAGVLPESSGRKIVKARLGGNFVPLWYLEASAQK